MSDAELLLPGEPRPDPRQVLRALVCLELPASLMAFSLALHSIIVTNLYLDKVCRVDLNLTESICSDLNNHEAEGNKVQAQVTKLELYKTLITAFPCILVSTLLATWSDRTGRRKPLIILPMLGDLVALLIYLLNVYFKDWPAAWLLLTSVYSLAGGFTTSMLALYSILASTTPSNLRTTRIGFLHVVTTGGWVAGNLLAPLVFHKWSYYGTFASSLLVALLSLLITCIALKDQPTVSSPSSELSSSSSSWSCSGRLLQAWRCMVAPRPARASLLLLLAAMLLLVAAECAGQTYLFTRRMFHWTEDEYARLTTFTSLLSVFSSLVLLPILSLRLGLPDQVLGLLATTSLAAYLLLTSFAQTSTVFIFANCLGLFQNQVRKLVKKRDLINFQSSMAIRSLMSKLVPATDLGKIYATMGALENLVPIAVSPGFTILYNNSLDSWPGLVIIFIIIIHIVPLIMTTSASTWI